MKLKQLVESPENEQRVKAAGWQPVRVKMVRLGQDSDPQEFSDEPVREVSAVLYINPDVNEVYTRSPLDDEARGRLVQAHDGIILVFRTSRYVLTSYDKEDLSTLTSHF